MGTHAGRAGYMGAPGAQRRRREGDAHEGARRRRREGDAMTRRQVMKEHYAAVLMDMCETRRLVDISVTDVVEQAGTAKQTFYNHFADINDLICYVASKLIFSDDYRYVDPECSRRALTESLRHRGFFCQLGTLHGQNNYWETYLAWMKRYYYALEEQAKVKEVDTRDARETQGARDAGGPDGAGRLGGAGGADRPGGSDDAPCDDRARQLRRVRIDLYLGGVVEVLKSWYARGAQEPVDMLVQAFYESMPDFLRDRFAVAPAIDPDDYPR